MLQILKGQGKHGHIEWTEDGIEWDTSWVRSNIFSRIDEDGNPSSMANTPKAVKKAMDDDDDDDEDDSAMRKFSSNVSYPYLFEFVFFFHQINKHLPQTSNCNLRSGVLSKPPTSGYNIQTAEELSRMAQSMTKSCLFVS